MTEYALYVGGSFKEIRNYNEKPADISHKGVVWLPVKREYGEPGTLMRNDTHIIRTIDPATQPQIPTVPDDITPRQFYEQLGIMGIITQDEAENALTGILPQSFMDLVDMLPEQTHHKTRMLLKGASVFERHHELTDTIAWMYGLDADAVDDLFKAAAVL